VKPADISESWGYDARQNNSPRGSVGDPVVTICGEIKNSGEWEMIFQYWKEGRDERNTGDRSLALSLATLGMDNR